MRGKKLERPFHLEMDFGEALSRYAQTDLKEVEKPKKRPKDAGREADALKPTASTD